MAFRTNKMPVLQEKSATYQGAVTFNTVLTMPLTRLNVNYGYVQSGTGNPAPDNYRPITPKSSKTINANNSPVIIPFGRDYYYGVIKVIDGTITETRGIKTLTGNEDFSVYGESDDTIVFRLPNAVQNQGEGGQACTHFQFLPAASGARNDRANTFIQGTSRNLFIQIAKSVASDLTSFLNWLSSEYNNNTPVEYIYNITPVVDDIMPVEIDTIRGNNTFWSDGDKIELTYKDLDIAKRGNFREVFKLPS